MSDYDPYSPPADIAESGPAGSSEINTAPTPLMVDHLAKTRPWTLFLSILLFVGGGMMALFAVVMFIMVFTEGFDQGAGDMVAMGVVGLFYLIFAAVNFLMAIHLMRYSKAIGFLTSSGRAVDMEDALEAQRRFWKLAGITTIVTIGLSIVGFMGVIIIAAMTGI